MQYNAEEAYGDSICETNKFGKVRFWLWLRAEALVEVPVLIESSELQFVTRDNDNTDGLDNGDDIGFYLNGIHFHLASFVNSYLN